jgi:hypothetical protein
VSSLFYLFSIRKDESPATLKAEKTVLRWKISQDKEAKSISECNIKYSFTQTFYKRPEIIEDKTHFHHYRQYHCCSMVMQLPNTTKGNGSTFKEDY